MGRRQVKGLVSSGQRGQHHQLVGQLGGRTGSRRADVQHLAPLAVQQRPDSLQHVSLTSDHDRQITSLRAVGSAADRGVQ
jgi:hypothetical protein